MKHTISAGSVCLLLMAAACLSPTPPATPVASTATLSSTFSPDPVRLPAAGEWDEGRLAITHGAEGEWDHILWGGFANSLIRKGDMYYLYYQGSASYDEECESVSTRAIGLATSSDGVHWTKSAGNPVLTWSSRGSIEEGAVSSAAWLGSDGKIYLYYGANTGTGCTVGANARLATSEDGETFEDAGEVLSGKDITTWGFGDEIFPIGVYVYEERWYLYYTPNGVPLSRKLGVAIGDSPDRFPQSMGISDSSIPAWGPVSVVVHGPDSVLLTNPDGPSGPLHFYRFDAATPSQVRQVDSYSIPDCTQASIIYEAAARRWMMACRDQNAERYFIRNAYTP